MIEPEKINALMNHESVREGAGAQGDEQVDISPIIESGKGIFIGDDNGGFLFHDQGGMVWEVHTQFLPEARGPRVAVLALKAVRQIFQQTDCLVIQTFVLHGNKPAKDLAIAVGFTLHCEQVRRGQRGDLLTLTVKDFVRTA